MPAVNSRSTQFRVSIGEHNAEITILGKLPVEIQKRDIELAFAAVLNRAAPRARVPHPRWEELLVTGGPMHAEVITLRAYGPLAVGKSCLLSDIMTSLRNHPRWKNRRFILDREGSDGE